MELRHAQLLVHDADHSAASRELSYRFRPPYFEISGWIEDPDQALHLLDRGEAMLLLDIPEHFARSLRGLERSATVQILADTSNVTSGRLATAYAGPASTTLGSAPSPSC